ncbi:MAG: YidC/Oxa1 family membrane protein insertase, partial [Patescibacteria group bacterium]
YNGGMITTLWNTVFYQPLYNGLIFLTSIVPGGDVGVAVILLTLIVKTVLFPVSHKSIKTQAKMRQLEPEIKRIKEKYKDKAEQAKATMELYKKYQVSPFSGCLSIIIQIPVILALYYVFFKGLGFDHGVLYSFVKMPEIINPNFLNLIDMHGKSLFLAVLAALSQYVQAKISMPPIPPAQENASFKDDLARSMQLQMKYFMPVLVFVFSYSISSAIALYWLVSNLFSIGQELFVKKLAGNIKNSKQNGQ